MRAVDADHPVFAGHFPGNPLLPGAYLLALVVADAAAWLDRNLPGRRPTGVRAAKFTRAVRPGEPFECTFAHAPGSGALRFVVRAADGQAHASGTLELAAAAPAAVLLPREQAPTGAPIEPEAAP